MKPKDAKKFPRPGIRTPDLTIITLTDGHRITKFIAKWNDERYVAEVKNNKIKQAWQKVEQWLNGKIS